MSPRRRRRALPVLTRRQHELLSILAEHRNCDHEGCDKGELVYEKGIGYIDLEPVAARTVFTFLRLMVISLDGEVGAVERYHINETGEQLLKLGHQ